MKLKTNLQQRKMISKDKSWFSEDNQHLTNASQQKERTEISNI